MKKDLQPTYLTERALIAEGYSMIVGVDEAGCGALAGPVVAGAVIFPFNARLVDVRDSKLLSEQRREVLYEQVIQKAVAWGAGIVEVQEITKLGIRPATFLAMKRAIQQMSSVPDFVLVDAWTIPELNIPQKGIVKGDRKIKSIAAASIVAKVTRDRYMRELHLKYPQYGFEKHKGYGTKSHRIAIGTYGPCSAHRPTYTLNPIITL